MKKIGIIGGGMMGLTLAYRLSQAGYAVTILESAPKLGGLATWQDYGDFTWDKYYHVILMADEHLLGLIDDVGLTDKLHWSPTKTGFLWQGTHVSMSSHLEFLTFPVLNFMEKARLAAGILYSNHACDPAKLEKISAAKWLTNVFGAKIFKTIWEPLLHSKFGVLKEKVPATIIWSTMNRYYTTRSKTNGQEWMGHLKDCGYKVLYEKMERAITAKGGSIFTNQKIEKIDHNDISDVKVTSQEKTFQFDTLISTIPSKLLYEISPSLKVIDTAESHPEFLGVIRLALVLKRSLSPYYVTNIIDTGHPYTGIIEVSHLAAEGEMNGNKLVMIPRYDVPASEWFNKSDSEIASTFIDHLRRTWPDIDDNILKSYVHRERIVQALWIQTPPPDPRAPHTADGKVWNVNGELAGRDTLNNNAIVRVANKAAKEFIEQDQKAHV